MDMGPILADGDRGGDQVLLQDNICVDGSTPTHKVDIVIIVIMAGRVGQHV